MSMTIFCYLVVELCLDSSHFNSFLCTDVQLKVRHVQLEMPQGDISHPKPQELCPKCQALTAEETPKPLKKCLKVSCLEFHPFQFKCQGLHVTVDTCCTGQNRLEEQQHPTDCTHHWCWIPHGWGWQTGKHSGAQWWKVPPWKPALCQEQWNGMGLYLIFWGEGGILWEKSSCLNRISLDHLAQLCKPAFVFTFE